MTGGRYLIVKLGALGDVAMASTLLGAIRRSDPSAHVTWVCGQRVAGLVGLFEDIDERIVVNDEQLTRGPSRARVAAMLSIWRRLAGRRFDVTLLGHADRRYRALLAPVRTGRLRTLDHSPSSTRLPIPDRYFGDEYVRLLDDAPSRGPIVGHAALADLRVAIPRHPDAGMGAVVLVPGGARNVLRESALKRWPVQRYRELAERLLAVGHRVTLVGDAADAWVRPSFAGLDVRDEIGAHDIAGTLALLRDAAVVVVHDTGVLHLARLVRTPVIALFGPTSPAQFVGEARDVTVLWGGANLACRPCYDGREFATCADNLCMKDIPVSTVIKEVQAALSPARSPMGDEVPA